MQNRIARIAATALLAMVCLCTGGLVAQDAHAETKPAEGATYVCPMRGKPCPMDEAKTPGNCGTCGMKLVTKAEYEALTAGHKKIGIVLYTAFETLDVYGPVEMWGNLQDAHIVTVAEKAGPVTSAQGTQTIATYSFEDCPKLDIVMVPGGMGTLTELNNERMLEFLRQQAENTPLVTSVCSGSMLLAKAGVLDGHKATSNKLYFALATAQSDKVEWVKQARWVEDGKFVTSSGVSAGIDMALHVIRKLYGEEQARKIATLTEYVWNADASNDPFAGK